MRADKKIGLWVLAGAVVVIVFMGLVHWAKQTNTASHENIMRMGKVIATTYRINSAMTWLEKNANGYYLTGDLHFKDARKDAVHTLDSLVRSVRMLANSNGAPDSQMDTLLLLLHKRIALSDSIVSLHNQQINADYHGLFSRELALDSAYNHYYSSFITEGSSILKSKIKDNYDIIRKALWLLFASGLLALFILVLIFLRINKIVRTRKRLSEEKIREQEQQYRQLIENARVVMYTTDIEGRFTFMNGRAEALTGYTAEELIGESYEMVIAPDFFPTVRDYYVQQIKLNFPESELEFPILCKDGSEKWVEQLAALTYGEDNRITGFQCIVKDIDEQKKMQLNMLEMEENKKKYQLLLQDILDNTSSLIFVKDTESKYLIVNKRFVEIFGLEGKDIIGKDDYAFNSPEAAAKFHEDDQWIITHKTPKKTIQLLETSNGPRSYMVTKFPLMTASGKTGGVCGIAMDISDQIEREKELEQAWKKAEEAEKAQEHFLAHISHEIRTPLNGIIGMTNLLKDSALTEEQQDFVKIISGSSEQLLYLINDLLDTAKIKAGKLTLEKINFNPREVINKTLSGLYFRAKEKKIELKSILSPDIPHELIGDPYRLSQILLNLLGNAIKFTDEGTVTLYTSVRSKETKRIWIQFVVEDTGIGIPADKMDKLFKEFSQASSDTTRKYGGTGLGLSITQKLVTLQEGSIEVESEAGKGSRFTISIPYAYKKRELKDHSEKEKSGSQDISLQGINILLAEDNVINKKVAEKILQNAGANTIFASTGKEAIRYLVQNPLPDLILMDLMMPEMDGYEATEKIRNELKLTLPIIAMTATVVEAEKKRCLETGMNAYISKPFSARELKGLIDEFVRHQTELHE